MPINKNIFIKALIILSLIISTHSTYAQLPMSGLVAWYPFCGNSLDESHNGHDLTNGGPTLTTDRFGAANTAYYFNGITVAPNNALFCSPPLPTDASDFTYATWFELDTTENMVIVENGDNNYDGYEIVISGTTVSTPGQYVAINFGGIAQYLPTKVSLHNWHHAVLRRRSNNYDLFIDTVLAGSFTGTFNPIPSSQDFAVGQDYTNGTNSFIGKIDDIAVYNRALTKAEIVQLYSYNPDSGGFSLGNDTSLCKGSIVLNGIPSGNHWSTGDTSTSITVTTSGTYWLQTTNQWGCTWVDSVNITFAAPPAIKAQIAGATCNSQQVQLTVSGADTYVWSPGTFLSDSTSPNPKVYLGDKPITFVVKGTTTGGCIGYDTLTVQPHKTASIGIPTAFSPNGDGANDILYVRGNSVASMDMAIYNRWGQKVFETNDINKGWDGTFNGTPQPVDIYAFIVKVTTQDGCKILKKGNVTLLK